MPKRALLLTLDRLQPITQVLAAGKPQSLLDEVRQQNQELLQTLAQLRERQEELTWLNQELEGINPEALPYVFDHFWQADSSTKRIHGGLGLGLAIVHHITELHGGQVTVDSSGLGQGATFTVRLPVRAVRTALAEEPQPVPPMPLITDTAPSLEGLRVLVVDDEPDARDLIKTAIPGLR